MFLPLSNPAASFFLAIARYGPQGVAAPHALKVGAQTALVLGLGGKEIFPAPRQFRSKSRRLGNTAVSSGKKPAHFQLLTHASRLK